jgi:ABC-type branched-subunit amino acid transport system ATPase component
VTAAHALKVADRTIVMRRGQVVADLAATATNIEESRN